MTESQAELRSRLSRGLESLEIPSDSQQQDKLLAFIHLLGKWNRVYNLTAINEPSKIVTHHILDSLSIVPFINGHRILDIGAGAGLPGIPLAIMLTGIEFTLIDSNSKKSRFMQQAMAELDMKNVTVEQVRVEQYNPGNLFDTVISRAFASLEKIAKLSAPLCVDDGLILAMKGVYPEQEIESISKSFEIKAVHKIQVPGIDAERNVILINSTNSHNLN